MKLIMENWRGYLIESPASGIQLPDEKTDLLFDPEITAMIEKAGMLEEGARWDRAKAIAKNKGIPIATALALMATVPASLRRTPSFHRSIRSGFWAVTSRV